MNGKVNINLKHYNSMQATIDKMSVDEKIIRIYSFCLVSPWTKKQIHFYRCIMVKTSQPPPWPLKFPTGGGGCIYLKVGLFLSPKKDIYLYEKNCKGIE